MEEKLNPSIVETVEKLEKPGIEKDKLSNSCGSKGIKKEAKEINGLTSFETRSN